MLFQKKSYLSVPLSKMQIFEGDTKNKIIVGPNESDCLLSDGTEITMFFEYTPKNLRDYGVIKEIATGTRYIRTFGFKNLDTSLYSEETGIVFFDYDQNSKTVNSMGYPTKTEVKDYLKSLKNKNLYKEYIEKICDFYNSAEKARSESKGKSK